MIHESGIIDFFSFIIFVLILYILSILSKRLGETMAMKKYYYLYYAGMFFIFLGSLVISSVLDIQSPVMIGYSFFGLGLTLGLIATIKYWGWLFKELIRNKGI